MANLDSRNKRSSAIGFANPWHWGVGPTPDGVITGQADRQQLAYSYPGILAQNQTLTDRHDVNTEMFVYLHDVVYAATPSTDLTTLLTRRLGALSGDMTARFLSIMASSAA